MARFNAVLVPTQSFLETRPARLFLCPHSNTTLTYVAVPIVAAFIAMQAFLPPVHRNPRVFVRCRNRPYATFPPPCSAKPAAFVGFVDLAIAPRQVRGFRLGKECGRGSGRRADGELFVVVVVVVVVVASVAVVAVAVAVAVVFVALTASVDLVLVLFVACSLDIATKP